MLLIVLVGTLAAGLVIGVVAAQRLGQAGAAGTAGFTEATQAALLELQQHASADRDAAVRAALEHAAVLHREMVAGQMTAQSEAGRQELENRRDQISDQLETVRVDVRTELAQVRDLVDRLGAMSAQRFGEVTAQLASHAQTTTQLTQTAQQLREALASPKARGQWGERMAEDVLRMAGFVENVNYRKQTAVEGGRSIPDYTFNLPKGHVLYMDVKFPLSAYLRYLDAGNDIERTQHRTTFLKDVRIRVKELAGREYADRERRSVDYVLLFIPNESVNGFIHDSDPELIDDAMRQGVVLCSPLTLFAMLGIVRQAFDNFMIEQTSDEILQLIGAFDQQWRKFNEALDKLGRRIEGTRADYEALAGPRRRQLQRPLDKLDDLRRMRGLAPDPSVSAGADIFELDITERGA
ncbi:MAG: DNA recombination protein RmuC [Acidimicrobiia bacterium]